MKIYFYIANITGEDDKKLNVVIRTCNAVNLYLIRTLFRKNDFHSLSLFIYICVCVVHGLAATYLECMEGKI